MKSNKLKHRHRGSKLLIAILCAALIFPALLSNPVQALAPPKDEVVYGKLLADGTVEQVYVVNAFTLPEKSLVLDQGNYSEVLNLSNTNPIDYKNGTIAVSAEQGRFYYQGNMRSKELPWLLNIKYSLDGQSIPASGLSGRAGAFEMRMIIDRNPKVDEVYFKNFVLQITMTVNAEKAINLLAEGATIANAGGDKVINWMVLPGQTAEYVFTADIKNFSMAGLQISAVPLQLKFEMPDMTQFTGQFADLHNGVAELNSGAQKLLEGANSLVSGAAESASGAQTLANNGPRLASGLSDLKDGIVQYGQGLSSYVDGVAQLGSGSDQVLTGFRQFTDGLDALKVNGDSLSSGSSDIAAALAQMAALMSGGQTPDSGSAAQLSDLVSGSQAFYEGLKATSEGLTAITGPLTETSAGLAGLSSGLTDAAEALPNIAEGLNQSNAGFSNLLDSFVIPAPVVGSELSAQLGLRDPGNPDVQILLGYIEGSSAETSGRLSALKSGLGDLLTGYQNLSSGLDSAASGISTAASNLATLSEGLIEISTNLEALNTGLTTLVSSYSALNDGIAALASQLEQLPQLAAGISTLSSEYASFDTGLKAYVDGVSQLASGTDGLDTGLSALNSGISQLSSPGTSLKDGADDLSRGAASAAEGVTAYSKGVQALAGGLIQYKDGMQSYSNGIADYASGTQLFEDSIKDIDTKIEESMNAEIEKMVGGEFTLKSFTSPQNAAINSVQFVLMTPEIVAPAEAEAAPESEVQESFWDRLLGLFR